MFGCRKNLEAEIVLFDKIDFNSGEYKLVFYGGEGGIIENYFNFYIDDSKTLNQIKKQWIFSKKSEIYSCGYSYNMVLVKKESEVFSKQINIECEYMSGWVYFPKDFLLKHKKSFKKINE
jgi:hypothetical protein